MKNVKKIYVYIYIITSDKAFALNDEFGREISVVEEHQLKNT